MKDTLACGIQRMLTGLGACTPRSFGWTLDMAVRYIRLGRWMADHHFKLQRRARDKNAVFDAVINQVREKKVLYLEFGVFQGASMRYWSRELKHPESVLHGFDSFEGLPESWSYLPEGAFTTDGRVPAVDDARVKFFKGWFDEVLPNYHLPEGSFDTLIINVDADLYSSTACILRHLRSSIRPGTFLTSTTLAIPITSRKHSTNSCGKQVFIFVSFPRLSRWLKYSSSACPDSA